MNLRSSTARRLLLSSAMTVVVCSGTSLAQRVACTGEAFVQAIQSACPAGNTAITFDCRDVVIEIDETWDRHDRDVNCDNVVIDGEDRNITFRLNPPCEADFPDSCPDIEAGAWFVALNGNNGVVRNLRVESFWEGIHVLGGTGNVVENVYFERPCDDAFTLHPEATATIFRGNELHHACDKALQIRGPDISATTGRSPGDADFYDLQVSNNDFVDCKQPIRTIRSGRFLVSGNTFRVEDPQGDLFRCDGPRFDGSGIAITFRDNVIEGCRRGLRAGENAQLHVVDNLFRSNVLRGAAMFGNVRAVYEGNRFENNGGSGSSEALYGGLSVSGSARVDAGGGSLVIDGRTLGSAGRNVFLGNRSGGDSTLDLQNLTTVTVPAENNFWGDSDPSDQVDGPVDFTPWLNAEPGGEPDPAPQTPVHLRRTDTRPS